MAVWWLCWHRTILIRNIRQKNNIHSFHLCMISGNRYEAWPIYLVWPISERLVLGWSGGTWPACCHWLNTGRVDGRCPIMSVLTQSNQCGTWFVFSTLQEFAVSNLGQLLFYLSITWSRCRNAYRDLWIMTIWVRLLGQLQLSLLWTMHKKIRYHIIWGRKLEDIGLMMSLNFPPILHIAGIKWNDIWYWKKLLPVFASQFSNSLNL